MSGDQNIWTRSTRLNGGPHVQFEFMLFLPNTIFIQYDHWCYARRNKSTPGSNRKKEKTQQRHPANSSRNDDKDRDKWWLWWRGMMGRREGGLGGSRKTFCFQYIVLYCKSNRNIPWVRLRIRQIKPRKNNFEFFGFWKSFKFWEVLWDFGAENLPFFLI